MAQGDVRPTVSHGSRGGWGGGSSYSYDDEGRGDSKRVWEWFEANFNADPTLDWLLGQDNKIYYWLFKSSVERYGLMDIAFHWTPGWGDHGRDTRAHRLVINKLSESNWLLFHARLIQGYETEQERMRQESKENAVRRDQEYAAYEAQRKVEAVQLRRDDFEKVTEIVDLTAGMLSSDISQSLTWAEREADIGDWIENTTDAYMGHGGWGYETTKAKGIKLQITLSLDLSNSMFYNGISYKAAAVFRDLGMALRMLKDQYAGDLFVGFFTFSMYDTGKGVANLRDLGSNWSNTDENLFHEFEDYRPSAIQRIEEYRRQGMFSGYDTYISPLLKAIEAWENENSDAGAVRLDIVLTDAVLEHKNDIQEADVIQERRNGNTRSVFLNFMPESDWLNSTMPKRCNQMKVELDNVGGILRNIISEFVGASI